MKRTHRVLTPAGSIDVELEKAQEMKRLFGYPYQRIIHIQSKPKNDYLY